MVTESLSIPTNGIRLHAEAAGPQDGPLVILLHGFPEYWGGWLNQLGPLSQAGLRVVAPDQRGYNLSDKPREVSAYRIDQLTLDVLGIMDYFGRDKACVVGHDWGAAVAWYTASQHPQRVEKLAILNVPHQAAMNRALTKPLWRQLRKSWYIFAFQTPRLPEWAFRRQHYRPMLAAILRSARPNAFSPDEQKRLVEAWSQPSAITGGINWYRAMLRQAFRMGPKRGTAHFQRRVTCPTLLLWGDQDAFLEPILADWSMEWVDHGRLLHFPNATHWLAHEEPEAVNRELIGFLRG
jgi:pimeloyl-ACP methyl ester carboxylesterase